VRVVANSPTTPALLSAAAGLTPGSIATTGSRLAARIASTTAAVAVLQATTSAFAPRQRPCDQHAAFAEEGLWPVAIGQMARISEIEEILMRQQLAQVVQNRQATEAGIEDGDGMSAQGGNPGNEGVDFKL
jgi:hypothetical protein